MINTAIFVFVITIVAPEEATLYKPFETLTSCLEARNSFHFGAHQTGYLNCIETTSAAIAALASPEPTRP